MPAKGARSGVHRPAIAEVRTSMSHRDSKTHLNAHAWARPFSGNAIPLIAVGIVFALVLLGAQWLKGALLGPDPSAITDWLSTIPFQIIEIALALIVLRYEGVPLHGIGLSPRRILPAVLTILAVVVVLNIALAALLAMGGAQLNFGFFSYLRVEPFNLSTLAIVAGMVKFYLFVGPAEELLFRGYLQNKLISLFAGNGRAPRLKVALAILVAAMLFAFVHVPGLLAQGAGFGGVAGSLVVLVFSGLTFGIIYHITRNLYFVALLHGIGDHWPLFVEPTSWPNWPLLGVVYALAVLGYWLWSKRSGAGV